MYEVDAVWGYDHSQTDVFAGMCVRKMNVYYFCAVRLTIPQLLSVFTSTNLVLVSRLVCC